MDTKLRRSYPELPIAFQPCVSFVEVAADLRRLCHRRFSAQKGHLRQNSRRQRHILQRIVGRYSRLDTVLFHKPSVVLSERSKPTRLTLHRSVPHVRSIHWNK